VTKDDLIRELYERLGRKHTLKDLTVFVDATFETIADGLKRGEEIQLSDFGTFSLANKTIKPMIKSVKKKKKSDD
jgi:nucleoid DNA-binding protein